MLQREETQQNMLREGKRMKPAEEGNVKHLHCVLLIEPKGQALYSSSRNGKYKLNVVKREVLIALFAKQHKNRETDLETVM